MGVRVRVPLVNTRCGGGDERHVSSRCAPRSGVGRDRCVGRLLVAEGVRQDRAHDPGDAQFCGRASLGAEEREARV